MPNIHIGVDFDANDALNTAEKLDRYLDKIATRKLRIDMESSDLDKKILNLQKIINVLETKKHTVQMDSSSVNAINETITNLRDNIKFLRNQKTELRIESSDLSTAQRSANLLYETLNQIPSAASRISDAFGKISGVFKTIESLNPFSDIFRLAKGTIVSKLTSAVMGNLGAGVQRYDTMKSYNLMMNSLGFATDKVDASMQRLDDSVKGLPTSLDEIVDSAKRFISYSGDIERGTDLAVAVNRAFLASGADAQQQLYGTRQIQDLLSAGELREQEWNSLIKSMPVAIREIGKELGYTDDNMNEFLDLLKGGKISATDFLNALIKSGAEAEGSIYKLAENSKKLITSVGRNYSIAFKRGYAEIIETFDEMSRRLAGKDLSELLIGGKDKINDLFDQINEGIKENEDLFVDLYNVIKDFPFDQVLEAVGRYLGVWAEILTKMLGFANKHPELIDFFSTMLLVSKPLSNIFGGLSNIFGKLDGVGKGGGIFTKLFGKGVTGKNITETAGDFSTGTTMIKDSFLKLAKIAGTIGIVEAAIWGAAKAFEELSKLNDVDLKKTGESLLAVGTMLGATVTALGALGKIAGVEGLKDIGIGAAIALIGDLVIELTALSLEEFSTAVDQLTSSFDKLANSKVDGAAIKENVNAMATALNDIRKIVYPDEGSGKVGISDWTFMISSIESMVGVATNLNAVATALGGVSSAIPGNGSEIGVKMTNAIKGIKDSLALIDDANGLREKANTLVNIAGTIKRAFTSIKNSANDAYLNVEPLANQLDRVSETLQQIDSKKDITIKIKISGYENIISQLKNIKKKISEVPSSKTVTITTNRITNNINYNSSYNLSPKGLGGDWIGKHSGGVVYKSIGGPIFRKKGSDTIPAMLTEGEFVQKRSAVKTFGLDFMQKVNNLDVGGALKSLAIRAGGNIQPTISTVRNVTNNNQRDTKFTQNIYSNNPAYVQYRAGRALRGI